MAMSEKLQNAIRCSGIPIYRVAQNAGVSTGMLYKYTAGIEIPKRGNATVIKVGLSLGVNEEECFSEQAD